MPITLLQIAHLLYWLSTNVQQKWSKYLSHFCVKHWTCILSSVNFEYFHHYIKPKICDCGFLENALEKLKWNTMYIKLKWEYISPLNLWVHCAFYCRYLCELLSNTNVQFQSHMSSRLLGIEQTMRICLPFLMEKSLFLIHKLFRIVKTPYTSQSRNSTSAKVLSHLTCSKIPLLNIVWDLLRAIATITHYTNNKNIILTIVPEKKFFLVPKATISFVLFSLKNISPNFCNYYRRRNNTFKRIVEVFHFHLSLIKKLLELVWISSNYTMIQNSQLPVLTGMFKIF